MPSNASHTGQVSRGNVYFYHSSKKEYNKFHSKDVSHGVEYAYLNDSLALILGKTFTFIIICFQDQLRLSQASMGGHIPSGVLWRLWDGEAVAARPRASGREPPVVWFHSKHGSSLTAML